MRGNIFNTGGVEGLKKMLRLSLGQRTIVSTTGGGFKGQPVGSPSRMGIFTFCWNGAIALYSRLQ